MIKHFVSVWAMYWFAVAVLPVHTVFPSRTLAFLYQLTFVLSVLAAYGVTAGVLRVRRLPRFDACHIANARVLICWALCLSLIGFVLLAFDKVSVQEISYADGIASAREDWRKLGEEREGAASSAYSAIGYLIGSSYFVALVLVITQASALAVRFRFWTLAACVGFVFANSLITGGRSNILLFGVFLIGALAARRGTSLQSVLGGRSRARLFLALILLAAAYTVFVFYERARSSGVSPLDYALEFLPFLGFEAATWIQNSLRDGPVDSMVAMLVLAVSYVAHSFATVASIVDAPPENKTILFLHFLGVLHKIGIGGAPDGDWFLAGRLPSVPGALLHQFGGAGPALGGVILGVSSAAVKAWTCRRPTRILPLGALVTIDATLMLTPALLALDFLSAPFILASFVIIAVVDRLGGRRWPAKSPQAALPTRAPVAVGKLPRP